MKLRALFHPGLKRRLFILADLTNSCFKNELGAHDLPACIPLQAPVCTHGLAEQEMGIKQPLAHVNIVPRLC